MVEFVVLLLDLFQALKIVPLMFAKESALCTDLFQINNANNLQWFLVQQTNIFILLRFFTHLFLLFGRFVFFIFSMHCAIIDLRGIGLLGFLLFKLWLLLLALLNCADQLLGFFVFLEFLLLHDFWYVKGRVFKRWLAFVRFDYFQQDFVYWKLLDLTWLDIIFEIILRAYDLVLAFAVRYDEGLKALFTECVATHADDTWYFLVREFESAEWAGEFVLHDVFM